MVGDTLENKSEPIYRIIELVTIELRTYNYG